TVFNILGPLTNPADAGRQLIGVCEPYLTELMASVLARLGTARAIVAHGLDGIDELSTLSKTKVTELQHGKIVTYEISPEEVGLQSAKPEDLRQGNSPKENAKILEEILRGKKGPKRDIVLLNAGAALTIGGKASSIQEGMALAAESIDNGSAEATLRKLIELSNKLGKTA
ncbi:MAG: anthranilate phosphoribosyltransferase, partial [Armatimonadota bacterium]